MSRWGDERDGESRRDSEPAPCVEAGEASEREDPRGTGAPDHKRPGAHRAREERAQPAPPGRTYPLALTELLIGRNLDWAR